MTDQRLTPVTNAILAHLAKHIQTEVPFWARGMMADKAPALSAELAQAAITAVDATKAST